MVYDFHIDKVFGAEEKFFDGIFLRQIGRLYCKGNTEVTEHMQPPSLYELTVVTGGEGTIYTNGVGTKVTRGDIYVSFPLDAHKIISNSENPLKYDFFSFSLKESELKSELKRISREYHSPLSRIIKDERIKPLVSNAIAELDSDSFQSQELLSALFKQIVIYTLRAFRNITPETPYSDASQNEVLCYKLMNYIDTHIYSMKNLSDLAETTDYSYGYLSTIFKKTTKTSLLSYYQRKKLDVARLLILEKKRTITEISEMLNYSSVYALSKAFSKQYGMSPRAYQASNNTPPPPKIPESVENTATNKIEFWHE